jgi:transcriptional regulator with GAF, ATPase, and Fis domain
VLEYTFSTLPPLPETALKDVDVRSELQRRPSRPPSYEAENRALVQLAEEMAGNPQNVLQKLAEIAMELCRAGSAGVSLLEKNEQGCLVFRWAALAGAYVIHRDGTMTRNASPCGVTIDRNTTQLMYMPERVFPMRADPRIFEALLVPFHLDGKPIGTVWVVTHDNQHKFDREDERLVSVLAKFASTAWMLWKAQVGVEELARRHWDELTAANEMLQTKIDLLTKIDLRQRAAD